MKGLKCMRSEDMGTAKMLENQTREVKKSIHKQLCEFYRKFSESCYEASLRCVGAVCGLSTTPCVPMCDDDMPGLSLCVVV